MVNELGGERIDIVPWHPDPEIFARRALAPARVAKVISDAAKHVMTAIVDEDQLSLAIGRNGQNVRLASQLIGWQLDLYGSREWLERGADLSIFGDILGEESFETSDFPLAELELEEVALEAGEAFRVKPGTVHRMEALTECDILEASTPHLADVVRIQDRYGRIPGG